MADIKADLKIILREADIPFFTDEDLDFYLKENHNDRNATAYQCLIIKSEESQMSLSGLSLPETSKYFRRLAKRYRPQHSGILGGR